jgi:hypothetical protein
MLIFLILVLKQQRIYESQSPSPVDYETDKSKPKGGDA